MMKKLYFLAAAIIFGFAGHAQCPAGGINLTSQAQVNNFIIQYPNCTEIDGDVFIEGNISNLDGLSNIITITGALEIREVDNLEDLGGLENLETVGTDLILREVNDLENITALSSLTSICGEFTVRSCPELESLDGVENLVTVGLGLIIRDCESLVSIEGLTAVTFVGEILEVVECPSLTSLAGLENILTIVGGDEGAIVIEGNDSLTSLEGLGSAATEITGSITISSNGTLSYCSVPAICGFLQNPPEGTEVIIGANVTGCNSEAQVLAACAPQVAPSLTGFTPENACPGSVITITGNDFNDITAVTIGGVAVPYTVDSTTQISAVATSGATGVVEVTNATGTATSEAGFTVSTAPAAVIVTTSAEDLCIGQVMLLSAESGDEPVAAVWSPVTNLFTDAEATMAYTGAPTETVYARPLETTAYAAQVSNEAGCTATGTAAVTVINTPAPEAAGEQFFCNSGTVGGLEADGDNLQWYDAETAGDLLTGDTALVDGSIYYVSQTANGCESTMRTAVSVSINTEVTPTPGGENIQVVSVQNLADATLEDISVTLAESGTIIWYASEANALAGEGALAPDTQLQNGTTYYATQTIGMCVSPEIFSVTVEVVLGNTGFDRSGFAHYPSPVNDVLTISYIANMKGIEVYNIIGQQVIGLQPDALEAKIDMASLAAGMYIINVTAGDAVTTFKVIKK